MTVTMKNGVFWDVTLCSSCKNRRQLLVTANIVPSSPILVTLIIEALSSSETSVLTRATRYNTQEDAILHRSSGSQHQILVVHNFDSCWENLKVYALFPF
jgi:hypothetical protein